MASVLVLISPVAWADTTYQIDIDNTEGGGPYTESGWTSLPLLNASTSGSVTIDGVQFNVPSFEGSNNGAEAVGSLIRDFAYSDSGGPITMEFGGAGDLTAGIWEVSIWYNDTSVQIAPAAMGCRINGSQEVVVGTGIFPNSSGPAATFQFLSDGESSYEIFVRDGDPEDANSRVCLNAVSLTLVERHEYRIDIDSSNGGGPYTQPGWTPLVLGESDTSGSVVVEGLTFTTGSHLGSLSRLADTVTPLTRDFAHNTAAAITMDLGGAGNLSPGTWEVTAWAWDRDVPVSVSEIGYTENGGGELLMASNLAGSATEPIGSFQFPSDGVSEYQFFIRDGDLGDGSDAIRLNALKLKKVVTTPVPVAYWPMRDGLPGVPVTTAAGAIDDVVDDASHPATDATALIAGSTFEADTTRGVVWKNIEGNRLLAGTQGIDLTTDSGWAWSLWIKLDSTNIDDPGGESIMGTRSGDWHKLGSTGGSNWINPTCPNLLDDTWHHVVFTGDSSGGSIYIDGAFISKDTTYNFPGVDADKTALLLEIGGSTSGGGEWVSGLYSDVAVWRQALSWQEVDALWRGANVVPDLSAPVVVSTTPQDAPPDVAVVGPVSELQAIFNEPVVLGAGQIRIVNDTIPGTTIIPVTDAAQVSVSGAAITITPSTPLDVGCQYHIEMDLGVVKNAGGLDFAGMLAPTDWNFHVVSPYSSWATGFPGLLDPNPALDADGGGLENGIEWVVGGDPTNPADDAVLAPVFDNESDPDFAIFTYRLTDLAAADANTTVAVEYGSDLAGWTSAVAGDDIEITINDDAAGAGIDTVQVKIRRTLAVNGRLFARLEVTATPSGPLSVSAG